MTPSARTTPSFLEHNPFLREQVEKTHIKVSSSDRMDGCCSTPLRDVGSDDVLLERQL